MARRIANTAVWIALMPQSEIENLIAFIEGSLADADRLAFEQQLLKSPALRDQLDLMQRIDQSAIRSFSPAAPVAAGPSGNSGSVKLSNPVFRILRLGITAVAASVLISLALFSLQGQKPALTASALYDDQVSHGLSASWTCRDDAEFIKTSRKYFDVGLLAQSDRCVKILGWTYDKKLADLNQSASAKLLLATVEQSPVVLILDKASSGGEAKLDSAGRNRLHLFSTNVGGVRVTEITPLAEPFVTRKIQVVP